MLAGLNANRDPELMVPCPPRLEELCVSGPISCFKEAALIPDIPSLRTLQLHGREESLDVQRLATMTALRSLCASTSDGFATIAEAVSGLTRLTRLAFEANAGLFHWERAALSSASHRLELSCVLQQIRALVSLRDLYLAGVVSREAQALDGTAVFPVLEVLHLKGLIEANDGILEFLACTRRLAAVSFDTLVCPGTKSALLAFRLAMARRIGPYVRVSVERWVCRDESEGVGLGRGDPLDLHASL